MDWLVDASFLRKMPLLLSSHDIGDVNGNYVRCVAIVDYAVQCLLTASLTMLYDRVRVLMCSSICDAFVVLVIDVYSLTEYTVILAKLL